MTEQSSIKLVLQTVTDKDTYNSVLRQDLFETAHELGIL